MDYDTNAHCRLALLVNNQASGDLVAEHGLSVWIEADGKHILFDTGQGTALPDNAGRLGIDLHGTDMLVLSHGHYDHTGGVPCVTAQARHLNVFCHPEAICPRYGQKKDGIRPIGIPHAASKALGAIDAEALHWVQGPVLLTASVGLTGAIPRATAFERTNAHFFLDPQGTRPDPVEDDQALWIDTNDGLVIVLGCAHAGLINTLEAIVAATGTRRIKAIIGGLHLLESDAERIERTVAALQVFDPERIIPCHCTGEVATARLLAAFPGRVEVGAAGCRYAF